ncbi:MAG: type II toxin-antitoxin system RelE/ParE family toxin [Deltaproteobacteria bacterium]|nr:type II toxin-antitoxin system RelE/ParE family toxin [Deltaproteobacteria bacterium]
MNYTVELTRRATKQLAAIAPAERRRIEAALLAMQQDPYQGDIAPLKGERFAWRRRVGNYRIIYELIPEQHLILVSHVERRTSTTYRKRR